MLPPRIAPSHLALLLAAVTGSVACSHGQSPSRSSDSSAAGDGSTGGRGSDGDTGGSTGGSPGSGSDESTGGMPSGSTGGVDPLPGSTSDTGTSGGPGCDLESNRCVETIPGGWNGPVALVQSDPGTQSMCGGAFPVAALTLYDDLQAPPAACTCECGSGTGGTCSATVGLDIYQYEPAYPAGANNQYTCNIITSSLNLYSNGSPATYSFTHLAHFFAHPTTTVIGGSCELTDDAQIADAVWGARYELCDAVPAEGSCEDGELCVPRPAQPFADQVCIWSEGDVACPAGTAYTQREVHYKSYTDDRDCSQCSCNLPDADCPDAALRFDYVSPSSSVSFPAVMACLDTPNEAGQIHDVTLDPGAPGWGACTPHPGAGQPLGDASPDSPYTVCCAS